MRTLQASFLRPIPNSACLEKNNRQIPCKNVGVPWLVTKDSSYPWKHGAAYSMTRINAWLRDFQGAPHHVVAFSLGSADLGHAKYLPKMTTRKG